MRLYLGNLPFTCTEADIVAFLAPIQIGKITICTDRETGQPRGFGFVDVPDGVAQTVISEMNGTDLGGRRVVVSEAREKLATTPRPRPAPVPVAAREYGEYRPDGTRGARKSNRRRDYEE